MIKKGEHGAFMFTKTSIFFAPAYPLESVFDPTGAGDSFAGGFMGYLARSGRPLRGEPPPRRDLRIGDGLVRRREILDRAPARDHARRHRASRRRFHRLTSFEQDVGVSEPLDYRTAGVDIDAADEAKDRIKAHVLSTLTAGTRGEFGGFGGMFRVPTDVPKPVLVSSADGVGTKLKVAIEAGRHDTVGHDLVNHCVNDILVQGAIAALLPRLRGVRRARCRGRRGIVAGVAAGCRENGCALLGGETAEMPGVYTPPDYDLAGFIVGYVDEDAILGAHRVREGDVLIGAREHRAAHERLLAGPAYRERAHGLGCRRRVSRRRRDVADVLLRSTVVSARRAAVARPRFTRWRTSPAGGFPGISTGRCRRTLDAVVDLKSWSVPNLFVQLQQAGGVERARDVSDVQHGRRNGGDCRRVRGRSTCRGRRGAGNRAWRLGVSRRGSGQVILS